MEKSDIMILGKDAFTTYQMYNDANLDALNILYRLHDKIREANRRVEDILNINAKLIDAVCEK